MENNFSWSCHLFCNMSIFFSIFRGHYLHDSSNSTSVCGLNIIWPFADDRRAITNYNNNLIFAKNNWFWFLGHIFRASLGVVYFCIADLTALIFEVRTERRGGRSDISGLQNILLGKLLRLCLDCFNHTNIGECRKKHWQSLQIHELRTNLILVNISLQSWIRVFFNQVKKSYLKKQAKKLRFLPLLIGLWTKYCSAGDGVSWQSIPKTIYASVLNALLVMCPFLIWTQRQTETTWDHQAHPPTRRPLLNFKWRCLYPAGSLSKSPPLEPEIYDQFVNRQILPSDTK